MPIITYKASEDDYDSDEWDDDETYEGIRYFEKKEDSDELY